MTQEGTEDGLFLLEVSPTPAAGYGGICVLSVGINDSTDGTEAKDVPNLLSDYTSNIRLEDMAEI